MEEEEKDFTPAALGTLHKKILVPIANPIIYLVDLNLLIKDPNRPFLY